MAVADSEQHFQQVHKSLGNLADGQRGHQSALAGVHGEIESLHRALRAEIDELQAGQKSLAEQVGLIRGDIRDFAEQHHQDLQRVIAQVGLVDVRAELDRRYGAYQSVRSAVEGILNVMDRGLAQQETLQLVAQSKAIDVPHFWLASMLNATVSWWIPDQPMMESALAHAISRAPGKTALFAGLLNARYQFFDATDRWFHEYLKGQSPVGLSDDFAVVLDSAIVGVLGRDTRKQVRVRVMGWLDDLSAHLELVAQQVDRWESVLPQRTARNVDPVADFRQTYPVLTRVVAGWPEIATNLHRAGAFAVATRTLLLAPKGEGPSAGVPSDAEQLVRVDQVLHNLCSLPEPGERELRIQAADLLRLTDRASAAKTAADVALEEKTTDLFTMMTNLALSPERYPVSARTIEFATFVASGWIDQAVCRLRDRSAEDRPDTLTITIESWSGEIGRGADAHRLEESLRRQLDRDIEDEVARERRTRDRSVLFGVSAAGFLVWIGALLSGVPFGAYRALLALGIFLACAFVGGMIQLELPRRIRAVQSKHARRRDEAIATLGAAIRAHEDLVERWNLRLAEAETLRNRIRAAEEPDLSAIAEPSTSPVLRDPGQTPGERPPWALKPRGW